MADSSLGRSTNLGSDQVTEHYCQPCFDVNSAIKPVAGYCVDCQEELCLKCYISHLLPKPLRNHRLVEKSTRPKSKQQPQKQHQDTRERCSRHHGESFQSFCKSHSQLCCKVCLTISHKLCQTVEISKMAKNIKSSAELNDLNKKLGVLKKAFNENLSKTKTIRSTIQRSYSEAIDEMQDLRDEFERKLAETENQVELVKVEDLKKLESVTNTSNVVIEEINKMTSNIEILINKGDNERVFISIKRAESELHSMEESLTKLKSDNTVSYYKFEPDTKLKTLLSELMVLGRLSGRQPIHTEDSATKAVSITQQMSEKTTYVKDIKVSDYELFYHGSVMMSNKQIMITDYINNTVKLIDTNNGSVISEIQLHGLGSVHNITKVSTNRVAVTLPDQNKIQIISIKQNKLSIEREIKVNGKCYGIAYSKKEKLFIVSYTPGKVEIVHMKGTVLRIIETDSNGSKLFVDPRHVVLSPDFNGMYVSDYGNHSVTLLTTYGEVKAVYTDNTLVFPAGMCFCMSGLMNVVGVGSYTVHQLDPSSGELKLLLDAKDGLSDPWSISFCDEDDKIYIGSYYEKHLKVFELK